MTGHRTGRRESPVSGSLAELLRPVRRVEDRELERRRLGRVHAPGPVAALLRRRPRPASLHQAAAAAGAAARHVFEATGVDADALVHDVLIRFCAAFLDQGLAKWQLPRRNEGFYRAFCSLYRQPGRAPADWMRGLAQELGRLEDQEIGPLDSILESLDALGVSEEEWERFLSATLLALRGWGGHGPSGRAARRPGRSADPGGKPGRFPGGPAVARSVRPGLHGTHRPGDQRPGARILEAGARQGRSALAAERRAASVPRVPARAGPRALARRRLSPEQAGVGDALARNRVVHGARAAANLPPRLRAAVLYPDARRHRPARAHGRRAGPQSPRFQAVFCLDEREESFRRHLEELAPDVETFGAAGFYAVAMYYKGAADAHFMPLCPVVIRPEIWVIEEVETEPVERTAAGRRPAGCWERSRTGFTKAAAALPLGAVLAGALGVLASFPLLARILFPRLTARIRHRFGRIVETPPLTRLRLERTQPTPGPADAAIGFSVEEMTDAAERLLRDIGLTRGFARLVLLHGHGSHSLNNPHDSAHNCGACGGGLGGPNARTMAQILNDPRVREGLAGRGLSLPADTVVVGGYHNTCDDSVTYYDLDRIPASHRREFETAREAIELTCERNAHERCRRFYSAPLTLSFTAAREHVEERAEDLAQVRPEFGHCTNAITIVGRREWTRGLFLDRRAFLTSYDPTQDDADHTILTRILQAVFPVCAGINLEYYFSNVDNVGFGCGTKLPHNLASLLGVMDGAASDLRTGLPWQMVEIHEPVRSLFVIETTPEAMLRIMDRNQGIGRLCRNGWVLLAVIDPETRALSVFEDGTFRPYRPQASVLPKAASSVDWYRGWRDHLEFAEIER